MQKTAIVTGGNRGIGFGIARCLARDGWRLAVCATREESACAEALAALRGTGTEVLYCRMNVADAGARTAALHSILERFGEIHLLVNNAGVAPSERLDVLETTEESFERVLRINLQGPFFLTQSVARIMARQQERRKDDAGNTEGKAPPAMSIVNISSISATVASISRGEYCISKAGVGMATKLWAARLAPLGIGVYEVRPGIIRTDMTAAVREKYDALIAEGLIPQRRWGTPDDVGTTVAALASGAFPYSTGQVVLVDGGQTIERL